MRSKQQRFIRWLQRIATWLSDARLPVLMFLFVALGCIAPLFYWQTELSVRISGLALQLLGIAAAAIGIRDTRRMFGKPSFLALVRTWFRARPKFDPKPVAATSNNLGKVSCSISADIWRSPRQPITVESQLEAIEENLKSLRSRMDETDLQLHKHIRNTDQKLSSEEYTRAEADRQLHLKIEAATTDGLHLATVGVIWLACGAILSSLPKELLDFFQ